MTSIEISSKENNLKCLFQGSLALKSHIEIDNDLTYCQVYQPFDIYHYALKYQMEYIPWTRVNTELQKEFQKICIICKTT